MLAPNTKKPRHHATVLQIEEIARLVRLHCCGENGYAVYEEGWDDHRIAEKVGASLSAVQHCRMELIGKLRDRRKPKPEAPAIDAQLALMNGDLTKLLQTVTHPKFGVLREQQIHREALELHTSKIEYLISVVANELLPRLTALEGGRGK